MKLRTLATALALVGAIILLQSGLWGNYLYTSILVRLGSLSGDQVGQTSQAAITSLQILGAVLLGVGLFRALEPQPGRFSD